MRNRLWTEVSRTLQINIGQKRCVAARERDHGRQEIGEQHQGARQQGDVLGLPRDDLLPELRHDSPP